MKVPSWLPSQSEEVDQKKSPDDQKDQNDQEGQEGQTYCSRSVWHQKTKERFKGGSKMSIIRLEQKTKWINGLIVNPDEC